MGESGALGGAWAAHHEPCRYIFHGITGRGWNDGGEQHANRLCCYVLYERVWSGITWGRQDRNAKDNSRGDRVE